MDPKKLENRKKLKAALKLTEEKDRSILNEWLRNHNWRLGLKIAEENARRTLTRRDRWDSWRIGFQLLREASFVSHIAYHTLPRTGFPSKSAMPDSSDEITHWQQLSAYLAGFLDSPPDVKPAPPMPSGFEIDQCDLVLDIWHKQCFLLKGPKSVEKAVVYSRASNVPPGRLKIVTGIQPYHQRRLIIDAGDQLYKKCVRYAK